MDKPDLITRLAALNPQLQAKDAELAVKVILDALCGNLAKGGRAEIRGFGSFSLSQCLPRKMRDQKNIGKIKAPLKYIPQFKPAKELRERVGNCDGAKTVAGDQSTGIHTLLPMTPLNPIIIRNQENTANHV